MYKENPKTKGSGIKCVIPQREVCKIGCPECFFSRGRSYLEPLEENLPNIPEPEEGVVYRINDGNDSSVDVERVLEVAQRFPLRFYNTSSIRKLDRFDAPVVLTVNPRKGVVHLIDSDKLMFVRVLVNTWNFMSEAQQIIAWYAAREIPVVLTFMAYHDLESIPEFHQGNYEKKVRTLNEYWCIKEKPWKEIMWRCKNTNFGKWISSCGTSEVHECKFCGNCLREFHRKFMETKEVSCGKQHTREQQ